MVSGTVPFVLVADTVRHCPSGLYLCTVLPCFTPRCASTLFPHAVPPCCGSPQPVDGTGGPRAGRFLVTGLLLGRARRQTSDFGQRTADGRTADGGGGRWAVGGRHLGHARAVGPAARGRTARRGRPTGRPPMDAPLLSARNCVRGGRAAGRERARWRRSKSAPTGRVGG